jgi:hypothetical protein
MIKVQPWAASTRATAKPMPRVAPVISATWPLSFVVDLNVLLEVCGGKDKSCFEPMFKRIKNRCC